MNKTIAKMKRANASLAFLIATIALTLAAISGLLAATSLPGVLTSTFQQLISHQSTLAGAEQTLTQAFAAVPAYLYINAGFTLLVAAGMWMHYFANKTGSEQVSTAGLTLIKVVKVFEVIGTVVVFLLAGFVIVSSGVIVIAGIHQLTPETNLMVPYLALAIVTGGLLLAFIFAILYYRGILKTIKSVKMTLSTGVIMGKVSLFLIVANYAMAFCFFLSSLLTPDIFGMVSGLLQAISLVFLAIALTKLRSEMRYISLRGGSTD